MKGVRLMKYNDTIRLAGIVFIIYGLQGIAFPIIRAIWKRKILFEFFHCSSLIALIVYLCFIITGFCIMLFTKPFSKKKKAQK